MSLGPLREPGGERDPTGLIVLKIGFHTILLLALPFVVGGLTSLFAEVSQVSQTLTALVRFASTLLLPVLLVQIIGITVKVRREQAALRSRGEMREGALLESVYRHVKVLSDKGVGLLIGSLIAVSCSLGFKFAELGMIAVLGLSLLYLVVAVGIVMSSFVVARFEDRLATRGGSIGREFSPVVVEAGEGVEERFHLERVPVPAGFNLRIHQVLPARFETESRHVVGARVSRQRVTLTRNLRRTPRGDYRVGAAQIAYSDLFGLTRVAVAQSTSARLKVLPRFFPLVLAESPRVITQKEGPLNILKRMPTDDFFRFRDYAPGDDTRRIHWKLLVKVGKLQVRLPETVPVSKRRVRLLLDTFLGPYVGDPQGVLDDLLDRLVEVWISLARALTERGEEVTLVLPTGNKARPLEEFVCKRGTQPVWREMGARADWQRVTDVAQAGEGTQKDQFFVVVTARFAPLPELPPAGALSWVFMPTEGLLPGPVPFAKLGFKDLFVLPFASAAEENGLIPRARRRRDLQVIEKVRQYVVSRVGPGSVAAEGLIRARGEPMYRVERSGAAYVLRTG